MPRSPRLPIALLSLSLVGAACGDDQVGTGAEIAGMCAEGVTDCVDTVEAGDGRRPEEVVPGDRTETGNGQGPSVPSDDRLRETAMALLGTPEDELTDDVRVARRGDERFVLTMDFRPGRMTVELDDAGGGTYVVVVVVAELSEQAETFEA